MRNLEEKEIKQFSEFTEVTPESSQNLITDKGRFTVGALYNAVIAYATNLINTAVNTAVSGVQELCNAAASDAAEGAVEGVEDTISTAATNAAASATAAAQAAKAGAETAKAAAEAAKAAAESAKSGAETAQAAAESSSEPAVAKASEASGSASAAAADKAAVQTLKTEVQSLKSAAELAAQAAQATDAGELLLAKSPASQFHFYGGTLAVPGFANMPLKLPISVCIEYDVDSWAGLGSASDNGIAFLTTRDVEWTTPNQLKGFYLRYYEDKSLTFHCANADSTPFLAQFTATTTNGNEGLPTGRHTLVVCVGGEIVDGKPSHFAWYLDGLALPAAIIQQTMTAPDITSTRVLAVAQADNYSNPSTVGGAKVPVRLSRAKIFNFLMDADGAPYTVQDYIAGKNESPLLRQCPPGTYFENNPEKFTGLDPWGSGTAAYDGTEIVLSGFNTETYGRFSLNFPQKITAGSRVRVKVRFESENSATYQLFLYETSVLRLRIGDAHDGEDFEWEGICPCNARIFYVQAIATWQEAEYRLVSSSIEVLGPVLSLADSADGGVVRDLSGAGNHAVIGGTVAARQNIPAIAPQKISWAGTATAQNVCGDAGAPADSIVTIYARASSALTLKTKTATHAEISTDLPATSWTLISTRTTTLAGAIVTTPAAAFTGSVEFNVKIERLK